MKIWLSRILIALVFFFNIECAISFIIRPDLYAEGFELGGEVGEAMIRGMGVLFLMWNVPYAVALWNPIRNRISLFEAVAMQAIGVVGESLILWLLPGQHPPIHSSILRFILFDAGGLVALSAAAWIIRLEKF